MPKAPRGVPQHQFTPLPLLSSKICLVSIPDADNARSRCLILGWKTKQLGIQESGASYHMTSLFSVLPHPHHFKEAYRARMRLTIVKMAGWNIALLSRSDVFRFPYGNHVSVTVQTGYNGTLVLVAAQVANKVIKQSIDRSFRLIIMTHYIYKV